MLADRNAIGFLPVIRFVQVPVPLRKSLALRTSIYPQLFKGALFAWLLSLVACGATTAPASASEYLGMLGEITKPESSFAAQLDLTDDQRSQLKQLVTRRTSAAVGLAAQLKDAPKSEHAELMSSFASESEKMASDLLQPDQREKLASLRIQWLGLLSLAEEDIALALNLADWQRDIVSDWREKVRAARRANEEDQVRPLAESSIRSEISDSQFEGWLVLAGLSQESKLGSPEPPVRQPVPSDLMADEPLQASDAALASNSPEDVSQLPVEQVQLQLNFQRLPWGDVVRWLAEQADLSVHSETIPPGTFTYRDRSRSYSITETLDIMNAYLLDSGYALFRQGRFLRCINFEDDQEKRGELLKELTDTVTETELSSRGRYEPVRVLFNLQRLDPDEIIEEVRDLLSIQGTAVSLVTSGQILVTDMAGNVRNVAEFIRRSEDPASARGTTVQTFPLKSINAEEVLTVARPLLELEADSNVSESIKLATNTFGTMIYARGDTDKIQIIRDLVMQMDRAPEEAERTVTYEAPYVGRHPVRGIDLKLAYEVAAQLLAGTPDVRLASDETAKQLVLQGRKADHEMLKQTLDNLAGEASDFKVISLQSLDTLTAVAAVKKFFNLPDKPDPASPGPVIDGDPTARQIWVKGSASQVQQIEELVSKLEQNAKNNRSIWGDRLRVIPLNGSGAAEALKQAEVLWQQVYGNRNPIVSGSTISGTGGLKTKTLAPEKPARTADRRRAAGNNKESRKSAPQAEPTDGESLMPAGDVGSEASAGDNVQPVGEMEVSGDIGDAQTRLPKADSGTRNIAGTRKITGLPNMSGSTNIPQGLLVTVIGEAFEDEELEDEELEDEAFGDEIAGAQGLQNQGLQNDASSQESNSQTGLSSKFDDPSNGDSEGAPIVIREGPGGLMISSDDPEALERFENLLRMIMEQSSIENIEPVVIYLQNIKAAAAKQLLSDILSGSASGGGSGGLIGDMASGVLGGLGGGMFGSLLGGGSGSSSSTSGSSSGMAVGEYSIVADPRLNVLFVKASPPDMKLIEQLLRVIDQVEGPFSVDVQGVMEMIPVVTQDVTAVLETVKSVFGDRIEGGSGGAGGAARQPAGGGQNPADFFQAMRSAFGGRGGQAAPANTRSDLSEPRIAIGADTFTNTLIVIGQPYQIEEIRRLVEMLDEAGESEQEEVVVVEMGAISSPALSESLQRMLGPRAQTNATSGSPSSGSSRSNTSSASGSSGQSDADAARRRAEFFQRMMQGQGGGGNFGGQGSTRGGGSGRSSNQSPGGGSSRRRQ